MNDIGIRSMETIHASQQAFQHKQPTYGYNHSYHYQEVSKVELNAYYKLNKSQYTLTIDRTDIFIE